MASLNLAFSDSANTTTDITTVGPDDWVAYPNVTTPVKKNATNVLSVALVGGTANTFNDSTAVITWTGGTPTASGSSAGGMFTGSTTGQGLRITAPAGLGTNTLTIYAGAYNVPLRVDLSLSDGSAAAITDTTSSIPAAGASVRRKIVITYQAASAGQTLTVNLLANASGGNINIQAAGLALGAVPITPPTGSKNYLTQNDAQYQTIKTSTGKSGAANDLINQNVYWRARSNIPNAPLPDVKKQVLTSFGYIGTLNDMEKSYWNS